MIFPDIIEFYKYDGSSARIISFRAIIKQRKYEEQVLKGADEAPKKIEKRIEI